MDESTSSCCFSESEESEQTERDVSNESNVSSSSSSSGESLDASSGDAGSLSSFSGESLNASGSSSSSFSGESLDASNSDASDMQAHNHDGLNIDPSLQQPLYEGANLTTWDSYLMIMKYALRHGLTKQAVKDLLELVGMHLPHSSTISVYKLKKFFLDLYEDISFNVHHCCSLCHSPFADVEASCPNGCDRGATEFLTISVEAQLKRKLQSKIVVFAGMVYMFMYVYLFPDPVFWGHLQKRFERKESDDLQDVTDGRAYRKHSHFLSERGNVSFLLNTDGVNLFRSSSISLWPIWLVVNELPPHVR